MGGAGKCIRSVTSVRVRAGLIQYAADFLVVEEFETGMAPAAELVEIGVKLHLAAPAQNVAVIVFPIGVRILPVPQGIVYQIIIHAYFTSFTFLQYSLEAQHGADFEATYCVTDIPRFVREHPTRIVGAFMNRPISAS